MTADQKKDKELDFIMDEVAAIQKPKKQTIKKETTDMDKEKFNKTKSAHKAEIETIKEQRAKLKQDIKRHNLLIKQAKIMYKLDKMKESK